jgi:hypothetical protein
MKCQVCTLQLYPKTIDVVGLESFSCQGYICLGDCSLNGLPVFIELKSLEYEPLDVDQKTVELSKTLTEPDYIKYCGHSPSPCLERIISPI